MKRGPIEVVAAVIRRGNDILLASRPADKPPCGWEFPGGKVEPGETADAALIREIDEELGVRVIPGAELETLRSGRVELHFIAAEMPEDAVERFAAKKAGTLDSVSSDPEAGPQIGWVTGRHLLDNAIDDGSVHCGGWFHVAMRTASRKLPAAVVSF